MHLHTEFQHNHRPCHYTVSTDNKYHNNKNKIITNTSSNKNNNSKNKKLPTRKHTLFIPITWYDLSCINPLTICALETPEASCVDRPETRRRNLRNLRLPRIPWLGDRFGFRWQGLNHQNCSKAPPKLSSYKLLGSMLSIIAIDWFLSRLLLVIGKHYETLIVAWLFSCQDAGKATRWAVQKLNPKWAMIMVDNNGSEFGMMMELVNHQYEYSCLISWGINGW